MPPVYDYSCEDCHHEMAVEMKISEYSSDKIPDGGCEKCKSMKLKRFIKKFEKHQWILPWGGVAKWHSESYSKTRSID